MRGISELLSTTRVRYNHCEIKIHNVGIHVDSICADMERENQVRVHTHRYATLISHDLFSKCTSLIYAPREKPDMKGLAYICLALR